jgi:hypothetical protein
MLKILEVFIIYRYNACLTSSTLIVAVLISSLKHNAHLVLLGSFVEYFCVVLGRLLFHEPFIFKARRLLINHN